MRKTVFLLGTAFVIFAAACSENGANPANEQSVTTADTASSTAAAPISEPETAAFSESPTTSAEPPTAPLAAGLNEDVLSDLGLTFAELRERRGEVVGITPDGGGYYYIFENGHGWYACSDDYIDFLDEPWGDIVPLGFCFEDIQLPLPQDDAVCRNITGIPVGTMFADLALPATVADIEEQFQLTYAGANWSLYGNVFGEESTLSISFTSDYR
jgi:hypothetical protein